MLIRSYARAFPTDRRIYRIDRWAIPIPGGLPLAASAWFLVLAIIVGAIGQLPGIERVIGAVGWPAAVLVAPGAGALALTRRCDDGRTLPQLAIHRATFDLANCRRHPLPTVLADAIGVAGDATVAGRILVHGPGRVMLPDWTHAQLTRSGRVSVSATADQLRAAATTLQLAAGDTIEGRS